MSRRPEHLLPQEGRREQPNVFLPGSLNAVETGEVSQVREGIGKKTGNQTRPSRTQQMTKGETATTGH